MELQDNEKILKTYRRHFFPYHLVVMNSLLMSVPFYALLYLFSSALSTKIIVLSVFAITVLLLAVITYLSLFYWLDKLVVTTQRVIFVDWRGLTSRIEESTNLQDIQDIQTREKGFLSNFKMFDFGLLELRTSSSVVVIKFTQAPDPENIKKFIEKVKAEYTYNREHRPVKSADEKQAEQVQLAQDTVV